MSILFALLLASPAAQAAPPPAVPAAPLDENRKICRTKILTGSKMQPRVCRTAAQWRAMEKDRSEWSVGDFSLGSTTVDSRFIRR